MTVRTCAPQKLGHAQMQLQANYHSKALNLTSATTLLPLSVVRQKINVRYKAIQEKCLLLTGLIVLVRNIKLLS